MKLGVSFQFSEDDLRRMFGLEQAPTKPVKAWINSPDGSESIWVLPAGSGTYTIDSYPIDPRYRYGQRVFCEPDEEGYLEVKKPVIRQLPPRNRR